MGSQVPPSREGASSAGAAVSARLNRAILARVRTDMMTPGSHPPGCVQSLLPHRETSLSRQNVRAVPPATSGIDPAISRTVGNPPRHPHQRHPPPDLPPRPPILTGEAHAPWTFFQKRSGTRASHFYNGEPRRGGNVDKWVWVPDPGPTPGRTTELLSDKGSEDLLRGAAWAWYGECFRLRTSRLKSAWAVARDTTSGTPPRLGENHAGFEQEARRKDCHR